MKKFALAALVFLLPVVSFAQTTNTPVDSVQSLINFIIAFINNLLVPLVFAMAFLVFILGVFQYLIAGAADPEKRKNGLSLILYSIIGFFAMVSIWGLVRILTGTVPLDNRTFIRGNQLPQVAPTQRLEPNRISN